MKHIKHWLMTVAVLLCSFTASAEMMATFNVDGIWYGTNTNNAYTVQVYSPQSNTYSGDIVIPSSVSYNGITWKVNSLKSAFYGSTNLTSVTIPSSVYWATGAFSNCSNLTLIKCRSLAPPTADEFTFKGVNKATCIISVPESSIGLYQADTYWGEFKNIVAYDEVVTSGTCGDNLTWELTKEGELIIEGTGAMYDYLWDDSPWLKSKESIKTISIGDDVTSIGNGAFGLCCNITDITIPAGITTIGDEAFRECSNIVSITISENVKNLGDAVFYKCENLSSVTFSDNSNLVSIGGSAFAYCSNLSTITIPKCTKTIGNNAFSGCINLTSIVVPELMESIGGGAFAGCESLVSVCCAATTPPSLGKSAFSTNITSAILYVPEESVSDYETAGWSEYFPSIETVYASGTCGDNATWELSVDGNLIIEGTGGFGGNSKIWGEYNSLIKTVVIGEGLTYIGSYTFYDCKNLISISIPKGITSIGMQAFDGCSSLADIIIPEGVTTIEHNAFRGCTSLTSITIPESVNTINSLAFKGCSNLASITFLGGVSISNDVFSGCSSLAAVHVSSIDDWCNTYFDEEGSSNPLAIAKNLYLNGELVTEVVIPDTEKYINYSAFKNCSSLTSVIIPESVVEIEERAFYGCNNLASVTCYATTPPELGKLAFNSISASAVLYVPKGAVEAYRWSGYFASIEEIKTEVLATSLTLDVTEALLAPDETLTLNATLFPADVTEQTLAWESSDEAVATVNAEGVVTAVADGEATIIVSTTDGSNLSATCVVTVETESEDEEMVDAENMIYFDDATAFVNTTISLPLQMKNSADITAVQFDVYLPEGVTIETNSRGKYNITFSADRADNTTHTLSSALQIDGAIRVICYSNDSELFLGSEGSIFNFPLIISGMDEGKYDICIKNMILTEDSGKKYEIASKTSTLNILAVALGDCNRDDAVDVADIVTIANHILGNAVEVFVEKAADYNNDDVVDVADIVSIANYILSGNKAAARALTRAVLLTRTVDADYSFDILPFGLGTGSSETVALNLAEPTESFTAFQCDIYLPEGITIDKNSRGKYNLSFNDNRTDASYHTLSSALQDDGAIRVICYSPDSEVFWGKDGALIYMPLTAESSVKNGIYEFSIANTVLTYKDGKKVQPETYKGSIIVGDGGGMEEVKLYGKYTANVLADFSEALATNDKITSVDLTEAIFVAESGELSTGNPNTLIYLSEGAMLTNESNVVCGDECANLALTDGYPFSTPTTFDAAQTNYTRTLNGTLWNALYLPFDVAVSAFGDKYDVACISKVEENEGDLVMVIERLSEGTLSANTPYFVRAKNIADNELSIESEGAATCAAEENTKTYTAGATTLDVVGNYQSMTSEELVGCYAISTQGMWQPAKDGSVLRSFRTYLKMSVANGAPAKAIRIRTEGETTAIDNDTMHDSSEESGLIYDLQGRRVDNPTKGMYIVNGKKVLY